MSLPVTPPDLPFPDRTEAGRRLAEPLVARQRAGRLPDPVVLALPRGGLPVAQEVARAMDAPLDVLVARKIGAPFAPELGVGAVAGEGPPLYDDGLLERLGLTEDELYDTAERERQEMRRREEVYRPGRSALELSGHSAVLVDDGLATGVTARAALHAARAAGPEHVVMAAPVCAPEAVEALVETGAADEQEIVCPYRPVGFGSVGSWYEDFPQLTDEQVVAALHAGGDPA